MPIDDLFQQTRDELRTLPSVLPQVERRIRDVPTRSAPSPLPLLSAVAATLGLILAITALLRHPRPIARPAPTPIASLPPPHVDVDGTQLTPLLAAILDSRGTTLVLWTYHGPPATTAVPPASDECRAGRYRLRTLRQDKLPDGRTVVCSLFTPDPGVLPALEPPSLCTTTPDAHLIACTTSPRPTPPAALAAALRSATTAGNFELNSPELLRALREEVR